MNRQRFRSILARIAMLCAILCMAFAVVMLVLVFAWGKRQEYTPEYVEHRLAVGMTLEQVAYELGPIEDLTTNREKLRGGGYRILLNEAGLGSWFAPQYEVSLEFGGTGQLRGGYAMVLYQMSDGSMALRLDRPRLSQ